MELRSGSMTTTSLEVSRQDKPKFVYVHQQCLIDILFQGIIVIYDNEKQRIGWIPSDCDVLPKFYTLLVHFSFLLPLLFLQLHQVYPFFL